MATPDVIILGAGIIGLSVAWECQNRGARVAVVDPRGPGGGASGGIVGALAPHVPENWNEKKAFQLQSLLRAEAFWRAVEDTSGQAPGYARTGRLQPLADGAAVALAEARRVTALGLWGDHAVWRVEHHEPGNWTPLSPTGAFVFDTLSARINPARACSALAAAIVARGGSVEGEMPEQSGPVVHATGWRGLEALSDAFGRSVGSGVKGQAVLLDYPVASDAPQIFADGLHIVPHSDGTVAIGSTTERDWNDEAATDAGADALLSRAIGFLPELRAGRLLKRWAGVRPRARSRAPILGPWPGRKGHFVANGGFKIGFGMAPAIAQVMADLVLEGRDVVPAGFRVEDNV